MLQVSFLGISRTTTLPHNLHCYEVTLVTKYNKTLLQKSETKIFDQKRFHKKLNPSQQEKGSGVLRLDQIMSTFLTISKGLE